MIGQGHFKVVCKLCKTVIKQCRCASSTKLVEWEICQSCKEKKKG